MNFRVKELAQAQGQNMSTLVQATGLARTTIHRYWNGYIQRPDTEVLKKLAAALNVEDWRVLLGPDDDDKSSQ